MAKLQEIKERVYDGIEKQLSGSTLRRIEKALESELVLINFDRLNKGIDAKGKKIKKLSIDYAAWKRLYVKGKLKHRAKTKARRKGWFRALYKDTEYKAKSTPNYGRLTGKTLAAIDSKVTAKWENKGIVIKIEYNIGKEYHADEIAEGLKSRGRNYYAALAPANTNVGRKERERIRLIIGRVLP